MAGRDYRLTIVMIGPRNVGKTVFLSALANSSGIGIGDPASVRAIKLHWEAIARGENPPATAATLTDLLFSHNGKIEDHPYNVDLRIPDYDGHFAEIMSEYATGAREIGDLRALIRQADGFIVFMPADERDAATMEKLRVEIGSFIDFARAEYGKSAKIGRPIVVAVNKWDKSPCFKNAGEDEAARAHVQAVGIYRDIYKKLESFFTDIIILPISAYGTVTEDGRPKPGCIEPYRVEEPVAFIVEKCFAALKKESGDLSRAGDWTGLTRLLLRSRGLWQRTPDLAYENLLREALAKSHAVLVQKLLAAQNAAEYDEIWKNAPERDFWADFSVAQRAQIEDIRQKCLEASGRNLAKKLDRAQDSADFEQILQNAPEGKYFADLDREQRAELLKLKNRHAKYEKRLGKLLKAKLVMACLFLALICWAGVWYIGFTRDYARATDPGLSPGERWHELANFIRKYEGSPIASRLFAGKLEEAAEKRLALVGDVANDIEKRLDEVAKVQDPCARAESARLLLVEANAPGLNAPQGLINRLSMLESQNGALCDARNRIENAKTDADLKKAEDLLAKLPKSPDSANLRASLAVKRAEVAAAASPEKARLEAVREQYLRLRREHNLAEAEDFVLAHQNDPSPEARSMAEEIRSGMGNRFYRSILDFARSMENFGDAELGRLRDLSADHLRYDLSESQRRTIAEELQKLAESHDREALANINGHITSQNELEDMEERLKAVIRFPMYARLEGNIFRYQRPENLRYQLEDLEKSLEEYRKVLAGGLQIRNFEVAASPGNALDLHGRSLGSAFTKNSELNVRFPGNIGEISYKTSAVSEHEEDGGKIFSINFGPLVLRPVSGEAVLREENFGSPDLGCSSPLEIDAAAIFNIMNTGIWRKPLEGSCGGISFIFHK